MSKYNARGVDNDWAGDVMIHQRRVSYEREGLRRLP